MRRRSVRAPTPRGVLRRFRRRRVRDVRRGEDKNRGVQRGFTRRSASRRPGVAKHRARGGSMMDGWLDDYPSPLPSSPDEPIAFRSPATARRGRARRSARRVASRRVFTHDDPVVSSRPRRGDPVESVETTPSRRLASVCDG